MTTTTNPNWRESANCATTDPELFFPRRGGTGANAARSICSMCKVQTECLTDALLESVQQGVRAGMSPRERLRMMREVSSDMTTTGAA